ncbi:PbsX family transcriptional regulator [Pseudomonas corrugata]|uniref:AbrB/MazE/SpoVT family DNA-binding domain-containing protein n=1 Tax=Pseudomonas corrugata TaxID=47879 RepID=UPI0018E60A49|nr:PbsX family transcriptional regulator [Pseudomonas corrugata]MBI6621543.1 PbsX family transcriptional regulator [Pseudomonas corrugata]MBI6694222.1 PbsX family transcriptional regulator [Pseudomonas corrugata]
MQVTIKKWGNSPSLRIPVAVMKSANLSLDSVVDVRVENGCVVIEPVYQQEMGFGLEALIAGITPNNLHAEVSFDSPVGKEAL